MPHTADVTTPEVPLQALSQLRTSMHKHTRGNRPPRYVALQAWAWSCTVLGSSCVPTNGHLASRANEVCLRVLLGRTLLAGIASFCFARSMIDTTPPSSGCHRCRTHLCSNGCHCSRARKVPRARCRLKAALREVTGGWSPVKAASTPMSGARQKPGTGGRLHRRCHSRSCQLVATRAARSRRTSASRPPAWMGRLMGWVTRRLPVAKVGMRTHGLACLGMAI